VKKEKEKKDLKRRWRNSKNETLLFTTTKYLYI